MAINQEIISTSWEGQQKSYIEAGLKTLLQRMLEVLENPLAANSVGSNQLTQELRDVINSIGSKVPNTRTVNSKELSSNITIGPDDIMVGNQTLADKLDDMDDAIGQGGDTSGLASRIAALEQALDDLTGTEDTTQIIDTFNEVINFLTNVNNNETLLGKLQQLQTQINSKANDAAVVKSVTINGETKTPTGGNVSFNVQTGEQVSVIQPTNPDGTFTIRVGETDYTINLNHVHPQYVSRKTVESNTDATVTLSADVIYNLGAVAGNKTINLPTTVDQAADYEFRLTYTSGTISGTAISGTTVANNATLSFTAGKTYQVIISGGILYFSETTVS